MNVPSRSDHYSMQIAAEIRRGQRKDPKTVPVFDKNDDLIIEFIKHESPKQESELNNKTNKPEPKPDNWGGWGSLVEVVSDNTPKIKTVVKTISREEAERRRLDLHEEALASMRK